MPPRSRKIPIDINVTTGTAEPDEAPALGPLFAFDDGIRESHARTRCYREEPIDEGHLGNLPVDADEGTLMNRWGGGTYKLQAIDEKGKILGQRTVKVAGEPRFDSPISKKRYTRWLSESFPGEQSLPGTVGDPVALEEARHNREIARIKAEADAALAKVRAEIADRAAVEESRRIRDREERKAERELAEAKEETRRERDREERKTEREEARIREERASAERAATEERRWKAEMSLRQEAQAQRTDPMTQFATMAQLFTAIQGGNGGNPEFPDMATAFAARLPETINAVRDAATAAKLAGAGGAPEDGDGYDPKNDVMLKGDLATGLKRMMINLKRAGKSDEEITAIMGSAFNTLAKAVPQRKAQPAVAAQPTKPGEKRPHIQHRKSKPAPRPPAKNGAAAKPQAVKPDAVIPGKANPPQA